MTKKKVPKVISEYFAELGRKSKGGGRKAIPDDELSEKQKRKREANRKYRESLKKKKTAD